MAVVPLVLAALAAASTPEVHSRGVNLYIGDLSAVFGYVARVADPIEQERERVRGHLLFAHDLLAAKDTRGWPAELRAARAENLARLRAYALAGGFPHNDDHADYFRPTFVDSAGTICAVGALFAADRGRDGAVRVADAQKYGFVAQMTDGELAAWQQTSGLSVAELGLIQPTYSEPPSGGEKLWLPFGLLDRMQIAPPRVSATAEMGKSNDYDTTSVTLHAQASTKCDCHIGGYGTLPISIDVAPEPSGLMFAPAPSPMRDSSRASLGTAEVGVFGGKERWHGQQTIYRLGVLLPTASREQPPLLASARVGDHVLELPRTMGVRLSTSNLKGWSSPPMDWFGSRARFAMRYDVGLDVAAEFKNSQHDRIVHVIPRAGIGTMVAGKHGSLSFDTVAAIDPLVDFDWRLRWSTGITGRLARRDGRGWFIQPALTLAAVRTPDGWGGTLMLDLAATGQPKLSSYDNDYDEG